MDPIWGYFFFQTPMMVDGWCRTRQIDWRSEKVLIDGDFENGKASRRVLESWLNDGNTGNTIPLFACCPIFHSPFLLARTFRQFQAINFLQLFDATKYSNSLKLLPKLEAEFQWPCLTVILFTIYIMKIVINHVHSNKSPWPYIVI